MSHSERTKKAPGVFSRALWHLTNIGDESIRSHRRGASLIGASFSAERTETAEKVFFLRGLGVLGGEILRFAPALRYAFTDAETVTPTRTDV